MNLDFVADIFAALVDGLAFSTYDLVVLSLSAAGILFVALFVLPVGLQRLAAYRECVARLGRLRRGKGEEVNVTMNAVMGCFAAAAHITDDASSYLRTVQRMSSRGDEGLPGFGTSESADRYFPVDKLGRSVVRDLAYGLGLLLTGLAVISLVLSAIGSAGLAASGSALATLSTNPYTIAAPAIAALALFVAAESVFLAQRREVRRLCWTLDELFLVPASMLTAEHLVASLRAQADRQREALASLAEDLRRAVTDSQDGFGSAMKAHDEAFFATMSERLREALHGPTKALTDAAKANAKDQSGRVKALVEELLKAYVAELTVMERTQLEGLKDVLAEMLGATQRLQEAFAAGADRVADDAVAQAGALTGRLETLVSDDFGYAVRAIRTAAEGMNDTTATLERSAGSLRDTVSQLQAALADLPAVVAPPAPAPAPSRAPLPNRRTSNEIADILGEFQEEADKLSRTRGRR